MGDEAFFIYRRVIHSGDVFIFTTVDPDRYMIQCTVPPSDIIPGAYYLRISDGETLMRQILSTAIPYE